MFSKSPVENPDVLLAMRETMVHRGPDDAGVWWSSDKRLGFAHRRLAILDLSPAGHQPMQDGSGRHIIVFNGEIYNHQQLREDLLSRGHTFRSISDTEVLLESYKEWGKECLERLEGAFAFAIYDKTEREIFLARDRAGEKPLFYMASENRFVFASELKVLMADPAFSRQLDLNSLDYYLTYGYVSGDKSILKDTHKLSAGHAMTYSLKSRDVRVWRYWNLPESCLQPSASEDDLLEELESILSGAIRRQLVADVPVGVLLSGGIDSSLITALAAKESDQPIKTFTISFPGHGSFDEGPYARLVAKHFGTIHTELVAEPSSVMQLPKIAAQYDEPLADHSIVASSILSSLVKSSVTVALGGDGGDELFAGYPYYNYLERINRVRKYTPRIFRSAVARLAAQALPVGTRGRNHIIGLGGNETSSISSINTYFDHVSRRRLLSPLYRSGFSPAASPESQKLAYYDKSLSIVQNTTIADFHTTMIDDYLVKTDRASMLHSLELRAPFLDYALIEFAFGRVPDALRASPNGRKIILRKLSERLLPPALELNRKQGLTLPLAAWFKGEWGDYMTEILMESDPSIFNKKLIANLIKGQRLGLSNTHRLFALTMFELWRREYNISS